MKKQNKIDFDFLEASKIEKITFSVSKKILNIPYYSEQTKEYIDNLLKDYNYYVAARVIFGILSNKEFIKNPGVALEYFLIDYLEDKIKFDKREPNKWEANSIDIFYKNLGIQVTVSDKIHTKENKIEELRKKINIGENLFYKEEDEEGNIFGYVIPNREIPKNLGLFQFQSKIIQGLVNSGDTQRFLVNIKKLSNEELIELYNNFEIIKKSFPQIIQKINYIEKDRENRLKSFSQYKEQTIHFNELEYEKQMKKINDWVDRGSPDNENVKSYKIIPSNISYEYNPKNKKIIFRVYSTDNLKNQNIKTLIYSFSYYFCEKKKINNSFIKPILLYKNKESNNQELSNTQKKLKISILKKKIKVFDQKIEEIKSKVKKIKINEEKINNSFIHYLLKNKELKKNRLYISLKNFFTGLDKNKKEEYNICLKKLELKNSDIIEIKKKINWLKNLIKNIERLLSGEIKNLEGFSKITDIELFLNDPILLEYNLLNNITKLKNNFKEILFIFGKIDNIGFTEYKLYTNFQKLLFLSSPKFNGGQNSINSFIKKIKIKKEEKRVFLENSKRELKIHKSKLEKRKAKSIIDKNKLYGNKQLINEIRKLEEELQNLNLLEKKLLAFKEELISIRTLIKKIDFQKLLVSNITDSNIIYTKKFLSNFIIETIFEEKNKNIKSITSEKIEKKLEEIFEGKKSFDIKNFVKLIELYSSFSEVLEENKINGVKQQITKGIKVLGRKLEVLEFEVNNESSPIKEEFDDYFSKVEEVSILLKKIFPKIIVEKYTISINNFILSFLGNKKLDFDKEFIKLIKNIGLENITEYKEIGSKIDIFNKNKQEILDFNGFIVNFDDLKTNNDFIKLKFLIEGTFNDLSFKKEELEEIKKNLKN